MVGSVRVPTYYWSFKIVSLQMQGGSVQSFLPSIAKYHPDGSFDLLAVPLYNIFKAVFLT